MILPQAKLAQLIQAHQAGEAALARAMRYFVAQHSSGKLPGIEAFLPLLDKASSPQVTALARTYKENDFGVLTLLDECYPTRIRQLLGDDAPPVLYYRGKLGLLDTLGVSIIGMRQPSLFGRSAASSYAAQIAASGHPVVSGNAPGIDAAAHEAALCAKGTTIVFPPSALERFTPSFDLCGASWQQLLVVSPFAPGSETQPFYFLRRNELVASHAGAAIVAETGARGGTLNTVSHLRRLSRPILVVTMPDSAPRAGVHRSLANSGAEPVPLRCDAGALKRILLRAEKPLEQAAPTVSDFFTQESGS